MKELFPDFDEIQLEQFVIRSNCNLDRAIDLLSEDNQPDQSGNNESFNLLPEVLNTWNEIIDMDEIERGFEAFDLEYQECFQSVSDRFTQKTNRFIQYDTTHFHRVPYRLVIKCIIPLRYLLHTVCT